MSWTENGFKIAWQYVAACARIAKSSGPSPDNILDYVRILPDRIMASNGYIILMCEYEHEDNVPASGLTVPGAPLLVHRGGGEVLFEVEPDGSVTVDGEMSLRQCRREWPDADARRILLDVSPEPVDGIAINPALFRKLFQALGRSARDGVRLRFQGRHRGILVRCGDENISAAIMPIFSPSNRDQEVAQ